MTEKKTGRIKAYIKSRDGFIVILVLCIMILLFAFGGGMLIAASTTLGSVDVAVRQEQVYLTATSTGELIRGELAKGGTIKTAADALATGTSFNVTMASETMGSADCTLRLTEQNGAAALDVAIAAAYHDATYNMNMTFTKLVTDGNISWRFERYWVG